MIGRRALKIGVFGNCQATGIADCLRVLRPDDRVQEVAAPDLRKMKPREVDKAERALLGSDVLMLQAAVTHPMAKSLETSFPQGDKLVTMPVLATHAFHPDCQYVRDADGLLINSPIGHYHSGLIAGAYLAGLPKERIPPLFNRFVFEKLGFRQVHARRAEFLSRSAALGYELEPVADRLGVFMHSINHPKIALLDALARQGLQKVGLSYRENEPLPDDKLENDGVFPVYPGLDGPSADDPIIFRHNKLQREFPLEAFVAQTYAKLAARPGPPKTPIAPAVRSMIDAHVIT